MFLKELIGENKPVLVDVVLGNGLASQFWES